MHEIFKVSKYKGKIKFDKYRGYQNGDLLQTGPKNSNFLTTHARHMKFSELGKYYKKIKFEKVLRYQNGGFPLNGPPKFLLLNH